MIAIIAGSKSDQEHIDKCEETLDTKGVAHQTFIMSAHRDPDKVRDFAKNAKDNGFVVIIAIAGLSNALAGFCASYSDLPSRRKGISTAFCFAHRRSEGESSALSAAIRSREWCVSANS